jgi:AcrR family transcriptional regulator
VAFQAGGRWSFVLRVRHSIGCNRMNGYGTTMNGWFSRPGRRAGGTGVKCLTETDDMLEYDWRTNMVSRSVTSINGIVDTRQQVLDEASRLFLHYGFKKTTMDEIARMVGISKGALYLHFESKEAIFLEINEQVRTQVLGILARIATGDLPADEKVRRMHVEGLLFAWDYFHQAPHAPEVWGETTAMFTNRNMEFYKQSQRLVAQVVAEGQRDGLFRRDLDPDRAAWLLGMACQGFAPPYLRVSERKELEQGALELVDMLLEGMGKSPRPSAV